MTCCIGALCEEKDHQPCQYVVLASDRMVTLGGFIEFEHEIPKINKLTEYSAALSAGDAISANKIISILKNRLTASPSIEDIAKLASQVYAECRDSEIDNNIFRPRGFSRHQFYFQMHQVLNQNIVYNIDQQVTSFNLNTEILIAGIDDLGAHLYLVSHPGADYKEFHKIGYHSIGSGAIHAMQSMIAFRHTPERSLEATVFNVYASKKRSEVAPGVGKDTDLRIIRKNGIFSLTQSDLAELDEIYNKYERPISADIIQDMGNTKLFKDKSYEK